MSRSPKPRRIALVGLMGAGKTRVGRLLAAGLGWSFEDADKVVEAEAGKSIPKIFREDGEAVFRRREGAALSELASRTDPLVVATGGGVVEREENRSRLQADFFVVWIRLSAAEAARRLEGRGRGRPLLQGDDPHKVLEELAARRDPLYRDLADLELRTDAQTRPEDLRDALLDALEQLAPFH